MSSLLIHMIAENCEMTVRSKRQPIFGNAMNKHIESQSELEAARAYTRAADIVRLTTQYPS